MTTEKFVMNRNILYDMIMQKKIQPDLYIFKC